MCQLAVQSSDWIRYLSLSQSNICCQKLLCILIFRRSQRNTWTRWFPTLNGFSSQGGPLGMLSGHLADYLQCTRTPPRSHEGLHHKYPTNQFTGGGKPNQSSDYHWTVILKCLNCLLAESNRMHSIQCEHTLYNSCDWPAPEHHLSNLSEPQHSKQAHSW